MLRDTRRVLADTLTHFNASDGWAMASHIALSMIMALFPFLIFATSFAGFLGFEAQSGYIVDLVFETWPDEIAEPIVREMNAVLNEHHAGFLSMAMVLAMFFASNGVEAVRVGLSRAYRETDNRSFLYCRLQSLVFIGCGALLLLSISFLMVFSPRLFQLAARAYPFMFQLETPLHVLRFVLSYGALIFAAFACHTWLPAGKRNISELWPGIISTLLLWLVSANLFAGYLTSFADYSATFAGLASIMVALIFLYLMAVILLLGGELNAALMLRHRSNAEGERGISKSTLDQKQ